MREINKEKSTLEKETTIGKVVIELTEDDLLYALEITVEELQILGKAMTS